jgi:hypothetical protein
MTRVLSFSSSVHSICAPSRCCLGTALTPNSRTSWQLIMESRDLVWGSRALLVSCAAAGRGNSLCFKEACHCSFDLIGTDADGFLGFPQGHRNDPPPTSVAGYAGPSLILTGRPRSTDTAIRNSERGPAAWPHTGGYERARDPHLFLGD